MKKKKSKRGGKRERAGRPELPEGKARVGLSIRVLPETREKIKASAKAKKLSVGKLLDSEFNPGAEK